jgi:hypothetical protein
MAGGDDDYGKASRWERRLSLDEPTCYQASRLRSLRLVSATDGFGSICYTAKVGSLTFRASRFLLACLCVSIPSDQIAPR